MTSICSWKLARVTKKKASVVTSVRATSTAALPGVKSKFKPVPHHIHPVKEGGPQLYTKSTHFKISSTKEKKKSVSKTTVIVRNLTERDKVSCYSLDFFIHFFKFFICWQFIWTYLGFLVLHTKNNYFQSCEGRTELQDVPLTRCLAGENEFYCAHCKLPDVFITYSPALFAEKRREHYILCKDLRRSHLSGG